MSSRKVAQAKKFVESAMSISQEKVMR